MLLCGQGFKPTVEEMNKLNELNAKLQEITLEHDWNSKQLAATQFVPIGFSWIQDSKCPEFSEKKMSALVITDDGHFKRVPHGKTAGIDYLREQREQRLQKQRMKEINDAIANLYKQPETAPKLESNVLRDMLDKAKKEMECLAKQNANL